jgi:hypothetical protein
MDGLSELPPQSLRVPRRGAGDQHAFFVFQEFGHNGPNLVGGFAGAENNFGKPFPQRPMRVQLRETEIRDRRRLKGPHHFLTADPAGAKLIQNPDGFGDCHMRTMPQALSVRNRTVPICG